MIGSGMVEAFLHEIITRNKTSQAEISKKMPKRPHFIRCPPSLSSHGLEWLEVETADRKAMTDIEEGEYCIFKYRRPLVSR